MKHSDRWTQQKIASRLDLIKQLDYRQRLAIQPFKYSELPGPEFEPPVAIDVDDSAWSTIPFNSYWGKWMTDFALRTRFEVPREWSSEAPICLYLPLGEAGDFSHPEALAYIDGQAYASADRHHHEILLPAAYCDGEPHTLALHGWTGIGGFAQRRPNAQLFMRECAVAQIDVPTRNFIAAAQVALDVAKLLDDNHPSKGLLLNALDAAFKILDTRDPLATEAFYQSVPPALRALKQGIAAAGEPMDVDIVAIGHAHIDVAWLWTLGQTRRKVGRTFSNVLRLMEQYPEYKFTQSQPQLYRYCEEDYPEIFAAIKERVKEGRWEVIGGTWVEPDCNAIGAEALARQFLLGRNYFREHFGDVETPVLWLPDTFGYSWALPQLIKLAGMEYFITHKMSWNQYNHMPDQILWWQGIDGTKVLTHFLTTRGRFAEEFLPNTTTYNAVMDAWEVLDTWNNFRQKETHNELLVAFGHGDGGGGPTREILDNIRQFAKHPAAPRVRTGTVREFMQRLDAEHGDDLPVWNGEFYLEYHRGTLTSQARTKWNNRKSEVMLHDAEFLATYAAQFADYDYPHATLREAWELTCLNQFHDILPGSSITAVYEDADRDYKRIEQLWEEVLEGALTAIQSQIQPGNAAVIFNPTSFSGDRIIRDAIHFSFAGVLDQRLVDGFHLYAFEELPPYSVKVYSAGEGASRDTGLTAYQSGDDIIMENRLIRLTINRDGEFSSIYDLEAEREVLAPGSTGNQLLAFEDRPMMFDAWDVDIYFEDRTEAVREVRSIDLFESGPLRAYVRITRNYRDSFLEQHIYLYYNSKRIDIDTAIDWHESHILLKAAFPLSILSPTATYEIQWGNVERPTHRNTSWDWAKFETAAQKWADLSEGNYGVALLNDSKYGYECKHNELRLTLLKSATMPDPVADQGWHSMVYSLLPHTGDWRGEVAQQAYDLNNPIIMHKTGIWNDPPGEPFEHSLVSVDEPNVIIETVKQAEDGEGIILRLYEHHRSRGSVTLRVGFDPAAVYECNLLEENQRQLAHDGRSVRLEFRPFQILTLRLLAK